jgi:hypothetical protein
MAVVNTARRLSNKIIDTDIESLNGLSTVEGYIPVRLKRLLRALLTAMKSC